MERLLNQRMEIHYLVSDIQEGHHIVFHGHMETVSLPFGASGGEDFEIFEDRFLSMTLWNQGSAVPKI